MFNLVFVTFWCFIGYKIFYPLYNSEEVIISFGINPFDICIKYPEFWEYFKKIYIISFVFAHIFLGNSIYNRFFSKLNLSFKKSSNTSLLIPQNNLQNLSLLVGYDILQKSNIYIPESGLYQNFLITGTIGTGKTSSAMYPFTKQLLEYNSKLDSDNKIGMLILDVKGTYYNQVKNYAKTFNLLDDLIVIELNSNVCYNPLDKPNLKPQVLANRIKTILMLFSENNSESYWLDKAEQILSECIKYCRLYNNGYVTFLEIHKLVMFPNYYKEKIPIVRNLFISSKFTTEQIYELNACLDFFENEFETLDSRTKAILKSEISIITNTFISDYSVLNTFCPKKEKLKFNGFSEIISKGKIVVLNMNIAEYRNLSKIIAAYLKLDFQGEIMSNLSNGQVKTTAFICDEYDKYLSQTDGEFFSLSREAKCINIISTQSYSSLKNALKNEAAVKVIVQNLVNKIWFRTDDIFTIEEAQKQLGKEDKEKITKSISENAKETKFSYFTNSLNSSNSNISESLSTSIQNEYIYDTNFFTRNLETFTALTFLSNGNKIYEPSKLKMFPYFKS